MAIQDSITLLAYILKNNEKIKISISFEDQLVDFLNYGSTDKYLRDK